MLLGRHSIYYEQGFKTIFSFHVTALKVGLPTDVLILQRELRDAYEYNAKLRNKLISAESRLADLTAHTALAKPRGL